MPNDRCARSRPTWITRLAAPAVKPRLPRPQRHGRGHRQPEHQPAPGRPAGHPALDQRHEHEQQHHGEQHVAGRVHLVFFPLVPSRQRMDGDRQHDRPDEEVDEEHPAPAVLHARELHDQAAEQRPDRRGDADHPAEVAECPAAVPPGEQSLDDRADRRVVDARAQPLDQAGGDQLRGVARDAAGHAGHGEQGQSGDEEPFVAEAGRRSGLPGPARGRTSARSRRRPTPARQRVACAPRSMLGRVTFTIVVSSTAMNEPASTIARIRHSRFRVSAHCQPLPGQRLTKRGVSRP